MATAAMVPAAADAGAPAAMQGQDLSPLAAVMAAGPNVPRFAEPACNHAVVAFLCYVKTLPAGPDRRIAMDGLRRTMGHWQKMQHGEPLRLACKQMLRAWQGQWKRPAAKRCLVPPGPRGQPRASPRPPAPAPPRGGAR